MAKHENKGSHFAETGTFADVVGKDASGAAPRHQAPKHQAPVTLSHLKSLAAEEDEADLLAAEEDESVPADALEESPDAPAAAEPLEVEPTPAAEPLDELPELVEKKSSLFETLPMIGEAPDAEATQTEIPTEQGTASEALPALTEGQAVGFESAVDEAAPRPKRTGLRVLAVLAALLVLLGAAYLGGVYAFSTRFLPRTTLDGQDVSLKTLEEVAAAHGVETSQYQLAISGQGLDIQLSADDIGLRSDGMVYAESAHGQLDPWQWPLEALEPHDLTVERVASFDAAKLEAAVTAAVEAFNKDATKPKDAKATFDKDSNRYVITPDEPGTTLDAAVVIAQASEAITELEDEAAVDETALVPPKVKADDPELTAAVDEVNARLAAVQTLVMAGQQVYTVDASVIGRYAKVSDKDLSFTLDEEGLTQWAQGELSDQLDSLGRQRTYTRPDGKVITVSGGTYGWNIDGATLAHTIATNVLAGTSAEIEVPTFSTAAVWNPGGQDWGSRYIDIDLSEQHVRMYGDDGSLIWESDCVTGKSGGHETPTGVYYINGNKESGNIRLEGEEDKRTGEPEYVSYVTYWMPFIWNAVALHDATWRYSFGGDIHVYDGSHGCVNLPYDKAEALFGITRVGDVVITHY